MGKLSYLRENWLGVVGLVVGALGAFASIYTYLKTQRFREPVFLVDPARTEILSKERITAAPIRVTRSDGKPITSDLTSVRFYFWNSGAEPIRQSDVLEPIVITLADVKGQILDAKLLKTTRSVTKLRLSAVPGQPRQLLLTFDILEHNDGGTGQIIFQGTAATPLSVSGTVAGARIRTGADIASGRQWLEYAKLIGILALSSLMPAIIFVFEKIAKGNELEARRATKYTKVLATSFGVLFVIAITGFVIWMVAREISSVRERASQNVVQTVPHEVLPAR